MRKFSLVLYNLLFFPLLVLLLPGYLLRIWRRGGYQSKAAQRFGILDRQSAERIGTGRIWLHAVSVGEVGIALRFASEFHRRNPASRFLISSTTSTGLAILENQAADWLEPLANPVDFPFITSRLVRKLRPTLLLMIEADLWPNRIAAFSTQGIPSALLNARLSKRSERRFRKARLIAAPLFNQLSLITLSEEEDFQRWQKLGVTSEILKWTGNIKYDIPPSLNPEQLPQSFAQTLGWSETDPILLAASTHEGEELEVARAFEILRSDFPNLRLIIAPRHVERRASITSSLRKLELSISLRSEGTSEPADLLLLDTTGELANWYSLATCVFVGKSLSCSVNAGGQNMIEPLQARIPVLIGPHTGNFEPLASQLVDAGAVIRVTDAESIAFTLRNLIQSPEERAKMIAAGEIVLAPHHGAIRRNCELVERMI